MMIVYFTKKWADLSKIWCKIFASSEKYGRLFRWSGRYDRRNRIIRKHTWFFAGRPSIYLYHGCLYHRRTRIGSLTHKQWLTVSWIVATSWDKLGTSSILSQFEIIRMTLNRLVPKLVSKHSKTRLPLELWTPFNYFVTLSNSKSVTKSSQYVTWPLNWYYII